MPFDSIIQLPNLYINGLDVSNDPTTPNTKINIAAGACRDSGNNMDMLIGEADAEGKIVAAPIVVNATVVGVNGIDEGALAANKLYAVYIIGDSRGYKATAGMISLASNALPKLPYDYDSYRKIGYISTGAGSTFVLGFSGGAGNNRSWFYNGAQTALSGGNSAVYANVDLSAFVPNKQNTVAYIESDFSANAANDLLRMRNFSATGDQINIRSYVAAGVAVTQTLSPVMVGLNSGVPSIAYTVSAGTVNLLVMGYEFAV